MKKSWVILLGLVFICTFSAPAAAASSKPPKNICFSAPGSLFYFSIGTAKSLTATLAGEKVSFYDIHGILSALGLATYPLAGTGYMVGDNLVFNLTSNGYAIVAMYGKWDVVTESGEVNIIQTNSPDDVTEQECILQRWDCNSLPVLPPALPLSKPASRPIDPNAMLE